MKDEKWYSLLDDIRDKFGTIDEQVQSFDQGRTKVETIVFEGASGKMKLERTARPLLLEKKVHFSKRIGSRPTIEYVSSETEKIEKVKLFRWDQNEGWVEISLTDLGK
ncbi:MAG: hypothetical protein QME66_05210 [Candidatus Eisenbacteria bacterium]|nr:hypothetical protein [Candidatus Eisenbacteria bacterium]